MQIGVEVRFKESALSRHVVKTIIARHGREERFSVRENLPGGWLVVVSPTGLPYPVQGEWLEPASSRSQVFALS